jgi:hypothetical protein
MHGGEGLGSAVRVAGVVAVMRLVLAFGSESASAVPVVSFKCSPEPSNCGKGRKILTAWPRLPRFRLKQRWTYRGDAYRLSPGRYRWLVWPGFGPRSKADYGRRMGPSTFVVRRVSAGPR